MSVLGATGFFSASSTQVNPLGDIQIYTPIGVSNTKLGVQSMESDPIDFLTPLILWGFRLNILIKRKQS